MSSQGSSGEGVVVLGSGVERGTCRLAVVVATRPRHRTSTIALSKLKGRTTSVAGGGSLGVRHVRDHVCVRFVVVLCGIVRGSGLSRDIPTSVALGSVGTALTLGSGRAPFRGLRGQAL